MYSQEKDLNEKAIAYIYRLFDDKEVFTEFYNNPLDSFTEEDSVESQEFHNKLINNESYNKLIYSIWACYTIQVLLDKNNQYCETEIEIKDFEIFKIYINNIIKYSKEVSNKVNFNIEKVLLYSFKLAISYLNQSAENKQMLRYLKKKVFKPIAKDFNKEYDYLYDLTYNIT